MFGGVKGNSANVFLDDTWKNIPNDLKTDFRNTRLNEPAPQHVRMLSHARGLEKLYFVNSRPPKTGRTPEDPGAPASPAGTPPDEDSTALGRQYIYALTRNHGSTLKHLLLSDQWSLTQEDIGDLIRYCPNLEQVGIAVNNASSLGVVRLLLPFLPKLYALRLLSNEPLEAQCQTVQPGTHLDETGIFLDKMNAPRMTWIGIGGAIFKIGGRKEVVREGGIVEGAREVFEMTLEDAKDVEIWGLDNLDLGADPVAPFNP